MKNIDDEYITAMNYYMSKKKVLEIAVALRSTNRILPQVKVYNTGKTYPYSLVHAHLNPGSTIVDLCFG